MSSAADTKASNRSYLSVLFFTWMTPMMELGSQRPLQTEDVYELPEEMHVDRVTSAFQSEWQRRIDNGATEPPSLIGTMYQLHHRNIIIGFLYWLSNVVLGALAPIFMMNLIQFLSDSQRVLPPSLTVGVGWAIAQYMAANGQAFGLVHARRVLHAVATELRTGMRSALFRKSLKLSPAARTEFAAGTVVNLMSNDCEQLMFVCSFFADNCYRIVCTLTSIIFFQGPPFVCMAVMSILQFIAYTALLLWLLGLPALAGLAVIFVALPALTKLMSVLREMRAESLKFTDQRMKLTNEILQGIKVLKLNAWEESYAGMVTAVRDKEVDNIQKQGIVSSAQSIVFSLAPTLMMMITYMVLSLSTPLQPSVVFATMNYFSSLTAILMMIPVRVVCSFFTRKLPITCVLCFRIQSLASFRCAFPSIACRISCWPMSSMRTPLFAKTNPFPIPMGPLRWRLQSMALPSAGK
jgi:ABC-type multidrug transport system fused ATPase/permease subunit